MFRALKITACAVIGIPAIYYSSQYYTQKRDKYFDEEVKKYLEKKFIPEDDQFTYTFTENFSLACTVTDSEVLRFCERNGISYTIDYGTDIIRDKKYTFDISRENEYASDYMKELQQKVHDSTNRKYDKEECLKELNEIVERMKEDPTKKTFNCESCYNQNMMKTFGYLCRNVKYTKTGLLIEPWPGTGRQSLPLYLQRINI